MSFFSLSLSDYKIVKAVLVFGFCLCFSKNSLSESSNGQNKVETLSEVTIIGNTELPNVSFDLPWQLPTIEKRDDQSPPKQVPGVLVPLEPKRHRQQLHFSRVLDVDTPSFKAR